jgi:serine/threonine-protein kinase
MEELYPRIGTTLKGKWRVDGLLGVGGMATVYAATHNNGKRVAIKILHPELSRDATVRQRFVREGYAANKVGRGAVTVDDDDVTDDGAVFLVMELLEGETLEARRQRYPDGRMPVADVASAMGQVLAALVVAHGQGIVHRDLKPENIFVTHDGVVKILDFGIARLRDGSGSKSATATGAMLGTPAFLPPEQARGEWKDVDARTDLWAVGATMFDLLSGRNVHQAPTVQLLMLAAMTKDAPQLRSVAARVPPAVAMVVDRALQTSRDARWPDAAAMREALRQACPAAVEQLPPMSSRPSSGVAAVATKTELTTTYKTATSQTVAPATGSKNRRRARIAVLAVGVLGAAVFAAARLMSTAPPPAATVAAQAVPAPTAEPVTAPTASVASTPTVRPVSVADLPDVKPAAPTAPASSVRAVMKPNSPTAAPKPESAPADPFSIRR